MDDFTDVRSSADQEHGTPYGRADLEGRIHSLFTQADGILNDADRDACTEGEISVLDAIEQMLHTLNSLIY